MKIKQPILVFFICMLTINLSAQSENKIKSTTSENNNAAESAIKNRFYQNAKLADLSAEKTEELLKLIDERNKVLKDLDTKKKQAEAPFSIQDPGTLYNFKINEARNYYAKKINYKLTYKQFCFFAADDYQQEAKDSAEIDYSQVIENNPNLSLEQKKQLYNLIYNYHLDKYLTTGYFSFDKTLQKPKLGIVRFNFEKEYIKICKEFNIKISKSNNPSNNNFQWN